jgi:hypothetical protein
MKGSSLTDHYFFVKASTQQDRPVSNQAGTGYATTGLPMQQADQSMLKGNIKH